MSNQAGSVGLNVTTDTTGVQVGMVQAAAISERELKRIASYIKTTSDEQKKLTTAIKETGASGGYEAMAAGANKVASAHAGVSRELLVLTHELSQGNFSRFGGSMLVLAEQTNAVAFAMTAAGAATLGIAGALVGGIALIAMGAAEANKFAKSLQLTGNYAATSEAQIASMARAQSAQTGQSLSGSRGSLEAVAGSGEFGPQAVASVARAMGDYQKLTGDNAAEALAKFHSLQNGVAKWAEEENRQMHFITLAEYEHIKALEESGQREQAAIEIVNALAQALESRGTPALGVFAREWQRVAGWAGAAMDAMKDIGRPVDSLTAGMSAIDRQMALVKQANTANPGAAADTLAALSAERQRLAQEQFRRGEHATDSSVAAGQAQAAIEAKNYTDNILKGAKALSVRTDELKKFDAAVRAQAANGAPMSAADIAAGRAEITKKYTNTSGAAQANEYANLQATIKAFNQTTDEEISRQARLTDAAKFSISAHAELEKAGKKLSEQQRTTISAAIDEAAAHRLVADAVVKAQAAKLAAIQADTANQQSQQGMVEAAIQSGNDQANAIYRQMAQIGKSTDEITKMTALQGFDDMIGNKLLGADNTTVERIQQVAAVLRSNLVSAIDDAKKAQDDFNASFSNGWDKAAADYVKTAANSAASGQKVFEDATNGMTDAITKFATTGQLSFKSLIDSIIADLVRMEAQKGVASLARGGLSGLGSILGMFGGTSTQASVASAMPGDALDNMMSLTSAFGTFANGLPYVPYDGFPAVLHEGEKVLSKQEARGVGQSAPTIHIDQSGMSFGAGVDASGVAQAVRAGMAQTKAEIERALSTNGRFS